LVDLLAVDLLADDLLVPVETMGSSTRWSHQREYLLSILTEHT